MGLKIKIGADSTDLRKGLKEANQSVRSFEREGSSLMNRLGQAIGVDVQQVQELSNVFQGAGAKIAQSMNKGNDSVLKMASSMKSVGLIAGAALGTMAIAWKGVKSAADEYYKTIDGQKSKAGLDAYVNAYKGTMYDLMNKLSEGKNVSFFEKVTKGISKGWTFLSNYLTAAVTGSTAPVLEIVAANKVAEASAQKSETLAERIFSLERKRAENMVRIADLEIEINKARLTSKNALLPLTEQQAAQEIVLEKMNEKLKIQKGLEEELVALKEDLIQSSPSSAEEIDALNMQIAAVHQLEASYHSMLMEIQENGRRLAGEWKKMEQSLLNAAAAIDAAVASAQSQSDDDLSQDIQNDIKKGWADIQAWANDNTIEIPVMVNEKSIGVQLLSIAQNVASFGENISYSIGEMVGNLINGEGAWQTFSQSALAAFGDMAIAVGKLCVSTGTATLGIKKALESLNGWVAIGAGMALIALGAAVKTSAANIAGGNYTGAQVGYASGPGLSSPNMGDYYERQLNITVSGELVADGGTLKAVINHEDKRTRRTT